jgi:hypothetical protein
MIPKDDAHATLERLFRRQTVARIEELFLVLQTRSRMSVTRRLQELDYLTSFTHSGRYYTLASIPRFDDRGLWFVDAIGFSVQGTLKNTVAALVPAAVAGMTYAELRTILRVRVSNTLRALRDAGEIGEQRRGRHILYLSSESPCATEQVRQREEMERDAARTPPLAIATVLEVLVEAIRAGRVVVEPATLTARLESRGVHVTVSQVREICVRYGVRPEKKTAR